MANSVEGKKFTSLLFIVLLAVLFALQWGPGSRGCDRSGKMIGNEAAVVTVNGKDIAQRDFAREYTGRIENLRANGLPAELIKQFSPPSQILQGMIDMELLAQAAESRGMSASDEDVRTNLLKDPSFQKNGAFNYDQYRRVLRDYLNTNEVQYEAKMRRRLTAQRMRDYVEAGTVVSDEEVKTRFMKEGNTANVSFVRFDPAMFASKVAAAKPAEVKAWADKHEAELKAEYEKKKGEFTTPEKAKVRQILLRVNKDDDAAKKEEVRQRAENLRKEIVDNKKPFAEIATQFSEDVTSKDKGGDIGTVDRFSLPPNFRDIVFALNVGDVSAPVETPIGFLIGTVEAKMPAAVKEFDAVKTELATQMSNRERAKELAKAEATRVLNEVKAGKKLADLFAAEKKEGQFEKSAEGPKPEVTTTGDFNSTMSDIPKLGANPELKAAIFARNDAGALDRTFTHEEGSFVVAVVDDRKLPTDATFEAQKAKLREESLKLKRGEMVEGFVKSLKQGASISQNQSLIDAVVGDS